MLLCSQVALYAHNAVALKLELNRLMGPWLEQTLALQKFCESNGVPFPPPEVQELFGFSSLVPSKNGHPAEGKNTPSKRGARKEKLEKRLRSRRNFDFKIPSMPEYGPRPDGAELDWKAVPLESASSLNLVLYILKKHGGAAASRTINAQLPVLRPGTAESTAHMSLKTLKEEGKITGDYREWQLAQDVQIEIIGQRMWCSPDQLRMHDRAALRREVILDALKLNARMTVADISEMLRRCDWLAGVAVEPNMVKGNMRILGEEGLAEKEGAYWKLKA